MNDKKIYQIVGVVLVIVALVWLISKKPGSDSQKTEQNTQKQEQTQNNNQAPTGQKPSETGSFWEGTLKLSDDVKKGNYTLQTKDRKIYIKTSRDYSSLVGKEVKVTYEGTLEVFRLGDIVLK